jgi:hypothetical protein
LHPAQLAKGRRRGAVDVRFGKVLLGVSAVAFIAGQALPFFPEAIKNADFTPAMPKSLAVGVFVGLFVWFLLGLLPLMFGWGALKHGRGVVAAYEAGKAAVVEGPLRKLEVRRRRSGSSYYYLVGDLQLWVVNGGWNTVQHEGKYRVYYVPGRFEVLSLELV